MPCIAALIPRKAYTQRLVDSRVPVTAARGGGTDLQRDGATAPTFPMVMLSLPMEKPPILPFVNVQLRPLM
ncbi:hypothetical protein NXY28_17830 [Bacteroides thetaiotaomicron]|nr:hypothetical protein NXY28_17830 [Bacteroides thetaiotaomicron]